MAAAKTAAPRKRRARPMERRHDVTISVTTVRWIIGGVTSLLVLYGTWKTVVWDDLKNYWRQETIQTAKDKETDGKLKTLAQKAEVGRAWLFWSINDMKAQQLKQWATACPALKQPKDICEQWRSDAKQYAEDAAAAKREAQKAGKDGTD